MPKPIALEVEITKRRIVEELEVIEDELARPSLDDYRDARNRLRELRIALETKPVYDSIQ
jgi:hypothetical protein